MGLRNVTWRAAVSKQAAGSRFRARSGCSQTVLVERRVAPRRAAREARTRPGRGRERGGAAGARRRGGHAVATGCTTRVCAITPQAHLGERRAAAGVVHQLRDGALDVSVALREVLPRCRRVARGVDASDTEHNLDPRCGRHRASSRARRSASCSGRGWRRGGHDCCRRVPATARARRHAGACRRDPEVLGLARRRRRCTPGQSASSCCGTHHAAQLGGANAVVRERRKDAACAITLGANHTTPAWRAWRACARAAASAVRARAARRRAPACAHAHFFVSHAPRGAAQRKKARCTGQHEDMSTSCVPDPTRHAAAAPPRGSAAVGAGSDTAQPCSTACRRDHHGGRRRRGCCCCRCSEAAQARGAARC